MSFHGHVGRVIGQISSQLAKQSVSHSNIRDQWHVYVNMLLVHFAQK